ncbi:hypothetical protein PIB30_035329 [Stylosanthes scabra]|uniref:Uncharacterized protein n=1 Tax=Stylosanthes scabra TaxID=79078 RepID=A0ABU6TCW6_9FABA|nr:hypothetical protein [Stylosanthes scabra]
MGVELDLEERIERLGGGETEGAVDNFSKTASSLGCSVDCLKLINGVEDHFLLDSVGGMGCEKLQSIKRNQLESRESKRPMVDEMYNVESRAEHEEDD